MARKRKSKPKGIKKGTATDNGKDTENDVPMNETLKTGAANVNEEREGHEVETMELNKERSKRRRKNTKLTEKTTSDQLNNAVDNAHEKEPEDEKQHDRAHAAMDMENEVPINETLKIGVDNVTEDREGYEVETTELNKKRNKRRQNSKVTAKIPSEQSNKAVDNGHEKKLEAEKQHDRAHAVVDKENESLINETLKTGADNGHEVETMQLKKKRNMEMTVKAPSDQLNYATDNGHEKKPEDEKQHDRTHAVMDTENESPINETLKTGAENVNEDGEGHEVETVELNTKRRNNKVTAKAPSDQLNYAMDSGHEKEPEAKKQNDRTHVGMNTENEAPTKETLKTGPVTDNKTKKE